MASLDDLLAALPDNDTGAIDAADLRYVVTELWNYTAAVQATVNDVVVTGLPAAQAAIGDLDTRVGELDTRVEVVEEDVTDLDARVTALETAPPDDGGTATVTASGRWQVNPQAGATPGAMQVTFDTSLPSTASVLRFANRSQGNNDMTNVLMSTVGVYVQQQDNNGTWARYDVNGAATEYPTYVELPVAYVSGGGSLATTEWQAVQAVFAVPVEASS